MSQYRVKGGSHIEDGQNYKKGEIVDSERDLMKMFPEKFEEVHASRGAKAKAQLQPEGDDTHLAGTSVKDIGVTTKSGQPPPVPDPVVPAKRTGFGFKKKKPADDEDND